MADGGDYRSRLAEEELKRYRDKVSEIHSIADDLKQYFRLELAKYLAEPAEVESVTSNASDIQSRKIPVREMPDCLESQQVPYIRSGQAEDEVIEPQVVSD